jgi:hypothetical protein
MVAFLRPTHGRTEDAKEAVKQAVEKPLSRHAVSIEQECTTMSEGLAFKIIKANVTVELAEHIINPAL